MLTTVNYPIKGTEYYKRMEAQEVIVANQPWADSNDRSLRIKGRHSRRYYDFVNRWLYNEVALNRLCENKGEVFWQKTKAHLNIGLGRLGMMATARQREA